MTSPVAETGFGLGTLDLHVHTNMSDGDLPLERVVAVAESRGVTLGVADHVSSRNVERFVSSAARLERYLEALDAVHVFRGAELCWCDTFGRELPAALAERLDYVIGSNHGFPLPDGTMGSPWWETLPEAWGARPQELMEILVHNLCDMVSTMPIDIAAHSTFIPAALFALEDDVHAWWTEAREDRYVDALARSGVALEISNRYRLPHDRILRKARQAGVRFSLGSDGHREEQVAELGWAAATARRVGVTEAEMFVPEGRR